MHQRLTAAKESYEEDRRKRREEANKKDDQEPTGYLMGVLLRLSPGRNYKRYEHTRAGVQEGIRKLEW